MKRPLRNARARNRKLPKGEAATKRDGATIGPSIRQSPRGFPIVGVGASAGGLEAFTQLLKHLPLDTGLGFVLVQHLDPQHESALTQLLARATRMPVREVTNNLPVEANHVYIIPPNSSLTMAQGILKLQPRPHPRGSHRSIDSFFESLAEDQGERAIGVILSGTATDGTLGLEAIKSEGGITFAQDDSAKYDSMPRSAVAAGCVDFVLSPEHIAKELARIAKHPYVMGQPRAMVSLEEDQADAMAHEDDETPLPSGGHGAPPTGGWAARDEARVARAKPVGEGFKKTLLLLRNHSGVDFSLYKSTTIQRRVTRRVVLNKQTTIDGYATFLRGNAKELDALYSDVLISVTSFFRNPEVFDVLKSKVFPRLLQRRDDHPVRVWILGCSTGQEAYSIAMAFAESAERAPRSRPLQVFATDLNDALLDKARQGLYAKSLTQDLSPERLRRFFVEEQGGYRIIKSLREMVVFARQNLISDPPFSRMDLISCRNLLIYLEPSLQKKALPTFHYALKPEGFLLLGASESIGSFTDLFEPADRKHKIYSRKNAPTPALYLPAGREHGQRKVDSTLQRAPVPDSLKAGLQHAEGFRGELSAQQEADRIMVNQFGPPGVVVNAELQILQFRGPTSAYLEPPTGKASFDVLKMAREGLMLPLRAAINKARKENTTVRKENIPIQQNGKTSTVNVQVIPLKNLRERCFLILFEDAEKSYGSEQRERRKDNSSSSPLPPLTPVRASSDRVAHLQRELSETRDYLQSIQEQYEAANEELQASNEEVQSANEELQSVNEELETSKEELESTNEELTTVNEEMANRNIELSRLNSDLINLQTSTRLAIVLLGRDLTIRRFSAQAEKQFNLLATVIGRPFAAVRHNLDLPDIEAFLGEVIATVHEREQEVRDREGRWYSLRARPYMTVDNKVDGAVLVLVDINELKRTEEQLRQARDYAEATLRTARDPLVVLREDLRVDSANDAFYKTFHVTPRETKNVLIYELDGGQWNIPRLRKLLEDIIPRNSFFNDFEVTHDFDHIGRRTMLLNARQLDSPSGAPERILLGIEDITERLESQTALRLSETRYRRLFEAARDGVLILDSASQRITDVNPFMTELLGYAREELLGKELWQIGLLEDEHSSEICFRELQQKGMIRYEDLPLQTKSGERREVEVVANVYDEDGTQLIQCNIRDITRRKQAEEALRESEQRYRALFELGPVAVYSIDTSGAIQNFNHRAAELWGREPARGDTDQRFCGSFKMFRSDGSFMPHEQCPMAQVVSGKTSVVHDAEVIIERPDGSRLTVVVNIRPLKNAHGETTGAINCFYDITERQQAEEVVKALNDQLAAELAGTLQLQETSTLLIQGGDIEALYQQILDAGIAIMQSDMASLQRLDEERGELRLLAWRGFHRESAAFWDRVRADSGSSCAAALRAAERIIVPDMEASELIARSAETEEYRRSGIRAVQSTPLVSRSGRLIGMISTHWREPHQPAESELRLMDVLARQATDLIERKQAEDALRLAQAQLADRAVQLEELVTERTARLQDTIAELEHFSYSITHDMRAPLRAMQGFGDMLLSDSGNRLTRESADYLRRITNAAGRMDALIQDSLQYAKVVRERIPLASVDPASVLRGILESYPTLQPPNVEIQVVDPLLPVIANETGLAQCFSNLLANAIKFVKPGVTSKIRISAERRDDFVRFWFEDNGVGIPKEYQERIFGMFQQLDKGYEGTGIGLALVRKTAERMNGKVGVESEPGQGSRFWLEFKQASPPTQ